MLNRDQFIRRFSSGIHLLDGATGTELRKAGLPADCCAEQWILSHPQALISLQEAYAEAGSEIIYAPTFLAQPPALRRWGLEKETERINRELVMLSRKAAPGCVIAGNLTTTQGLAGDREDTEDAYRRQVGALVRAGADILAAETLMSIREAETILAAARELSAPAVTVSFACREDGRLYSGERVTEAVQAAERAGAAAAGVNCVPVSDTLPDMIGELRGCTSLPLICKPNAGHPVKGRYPVDPEHFASILAECAGKGANLAGGCCGTTPDYIRLAAGMLERDHHKPAGTE